MKKLFRIFIVVLIIGGSAAANAGVAVTPAEEAGLRNLSAVRALALANDWKMAGKEAKTYVTPRAVVFDLPNGRTYKVPLPDDKMVIAVAPYIKQTHE